MIKNNLPNILKERGMSIYALAQASGLSYPTVHKIARDEAEFPDPDHSLTYKTMDLICETLGIQPGEILMRVPDSKDEM